MVKLMRTDFGKEKPKGLLMGLRLEMPKARQKH